MSDSISFGLALILAVPLLGAGRPAAAAPPPVTPPPAWPSATVADASVFTIARDAKGNPTEDTKTEASLTKTLTGETIVLTANGAMVGHLNGTTFVPDITALQASDSMNTFSIMDSLGEDTTTGSKALSSFHANLVRADTTSTTGFLQGHLLQVAADGSSTSSDIFLDVNFSTTPAPTTPPATTPPTSTTPTPAPAITPAPRQ
jgi:hypothetical protein